MTVRDRKDGKLRHQTVSAWIKERRPSFTEADLAAALEEQVRAKDTVSLPAAELEFWKQHSGVNTAPDKVAQASASSAASKMLLDATSHTAVEVGIMLELASSTVRHYKAERKLYAYTANGKLLFPDWQFDRGRALPHLDKVLAVMAEDLHPQTVAGFFRSPKPELVLDGSPVGPIEWLVSGGSEEPVVQLARFVGSAV